MLTIPAKFMLQNQAPIHNREIIFVADRSGSMTDKIDSLKSSMSFFLKGLPQESHFNIWCFGDTVDSLWPRSEGYSDANLRAALSYVSRRFKADMGGTRLLPALEAVFNAAGAYHATDIVVLTDGQIWDLDTTLDLVQQKRTTSEGRMRLFALGIGDAVSHELVEGLATAGGGYAEVIPAATQGGWESSVVAVLQAALAGHVGPFQIELNQHLDIDQRKSRPCPQIRSHAEHFLGDVHRSEASLAEEVLWSPAKISSLSPFLRNRVFMLMDSTARLSTPLTGLTIKAARPGAEEVSTLVSIKMPSRPDSTIHKLGGRTILDDLERGQSHIHLGADAPSRESYQEMVRAEGERLGCKWSLVSKWTSFVTVEELFSDAQTDPNPFMDTDEPGVEVAGAGDLDLLRPRGPQGRLADNLLDHEAGQVASDEEDASTESSSEAEGPSRRDDDGDSDGPGDDNVGSQRPDQRGDDRHGQDPNDDRDADRLSGNSQDPGAGTLAGTSGTTNRSGVRLPQDVDDTEYKMPSHSNCLAILSALQAEWDSLDVQTQNPIKRVPLLGTVTLHVPTPS